MLFSTFSQILFPNERDTENALNMLNPLEILVNNKYNIVKVP